MAAFSLERASFNVSSFRGTLAKNKPQRWHPTAPAFRSDSPSVSVPRCKAYIQTQLHSRRPPRLFPFKSKVGVLKPTSWSSVQRLTERAQGKIYALQNEGEALERIRNQLEEQLSKSGVAGGEVCAEVAPFDKWPQLLLLLFAIGTVSGPLLDGIHSSAGLQLYDTGAIEIPIGKVVLKTDVWVFPLLGVFYAVVGGLYPYLDDIFTPKAPKITATKSPEDTEEMSPESTQTKIEVDEDDEDPGLLRATWGPTVTPEEDKQLPPWLEVAPPFQFIFLTFLLAGSAWLYRNDVGYDVIWFVLIGFSVGCWAALDATWWGLLIAFACAGWAPAAELVLNKLFHLWHYPRADVFIEDEGLVSWVSMCYFFYCPPLGNLGRFLRARLQGQSERCSKR